MEKVREFRDAEGHLWHAGFGYRGGLDYQGRYYLSFRPAEGGAVVSLQDVRWNSEHTALRRLETFSEVELRRRLRSAVGRATQGVQP